jgi:hypothetical protein
MHQVCLEPAPKAVCGSMSGDVVSDSATQQQRSLLLVAGGHVELPVPLGKCLLECRNIGNARYDARRGRREASSPAEKLGDEDPGNGLGGGEDADEPVPIGGERDGATAEFYPLAGSRDSRSEWALAILDDGKGDFEACTTSNVREVLGAPRWSSTHTHTHTHTHVYM